MRAYFSYTGKNKVHGLLPQLQCHIVPPVLGKMMSLPVHSFPIRKAPTPNATIVEKVLKFKNKRSVYTLQSALTQLHIRITWEAFGKYKCTNLISRDSGSLGLHWGQSTCFLQLHGTASSAGIGAWTARRQEGNTAVFL